MGKVALIIIYNHQYIRNIEIIERIYHDRFEYIYHLMPFYNGEKKNVISVYECSFFFQGYVAQGFINFYNERFDHYFFVADDLLLNPLINENNYKEYFNLNNHTCFLPDFISLHEREEWWPRVGEAFRYDINTPGVEVKGQIPDYDHALQLFNKFGLEIKPLRFDQIYNVKINDKLTVKYNLPYPFVGSYSDIFIISSNIIRQFCHYCGVFAATRLFVEIGLPTAMVLSAGEIVTEKNLQLQGKALWTESDYLIIEKFNKNFQRLFREFPQNLLYIHPIKLSQWHQKKV